jgi:hypothetical protein
MEVLTVMLLVLTVLGLGAVANDENRPGPGDGASRMA